MADHAIRCIPARRTPGGRAFPFIFGLCSKPWYNPRWAVWCTRTQPGKRTRTYRRLYSMKESATDV